MKPPNFLTSFFDPSASRNLDDWRVEILNGVLRAIFFIWLIGLVSGIYNVVKTYRLEAHRYENPLVLAVSIIGIFVVVTILLAVITFNRRLHYDLRAGLFLFILYVLGLTGLYNTSLSGDGRIFLFALVIFTGVFFNLYASLISLGGSLLTILVMGWLQVTKVVEVSAEVQVVSTDAAAWVSASLVFLVLSVAALVSITYLLRTLDQSIIQVRTSLEREKRLGQILRTISDSNQLIIRSEDAETLLRGICELLISDQRYNFAWIGLLEADNISFKLAAYAGETIDEEKFNFRLEQETNGLTCVSEAIRTRSYFHVKPDEINDPCPTCPHRLMHPDRSALSLPFVRNERVLGVMVVDYAQHVKDFSLQEILLLQELADDLAYALEKLELDRRLQEDAPYKSLLSDVTSLALKTTDQTFLLQSVSEKMHTVFNASACYIVLWDDSWQLPRSIVAPGYLRDRFNQLQITADEAQTLKILFQDEKTLIAEDAGTDPRISGRIVDLLSIHSMLGVPLMTGKRWLGGVFLTYDKQRSFPQTVVSFAEQIAGQIALALERIHLQDETQAKAAELEVLYAAAQDMASSLLDPPALLEKLARHMTGSLQVTSANIMSVNLADDMMQVVGEYWSDQALPQEIHPDLGRVFQNAPYSTIMNAMLAGKVIEMHFDDEEMTSTERGQFSEFGIKTMMFVPIMAHGQLFGDIELWESRHRREFTEAEVRLAQAMAGHAASIIESSNLFAQTRQRESELAALLTVARAVSSSLQLTQVLEKAATTLARLLRVDFCSLSDYLPNQNAIVTTALYSADGDVSGVGDLGHYFSLDDYPATRNVLESGQPLINRLDDPNTDPSEIRQLLHDEMRTSLIIPLRLRGRSLGLAELFSADPNRVFKAEEVQFACAIADQVAVAIEHANLYERLEQREAHFRALIENSAEGFAILDARGIVRYLAPSEERLTGYKVEEIVGQSAFTYIHPDDQPRMLEIFSEGVATPGAVRTTQYRLKRKDGEWRYFEITGHNMLDDSHIAGVVVNYRNVTERKFAERALEESEERYRTIFQSAGVPIWEDDYSALMNEIDAIKKTGVIDFETYLNENPDFITNAATLIKILDVNEATVGLMEAADKSELLGPLDQLFSGGGSFPYFAKEVIALANGMRHYEHEAALYTLQGKRRDVWISITLPQWAVGYERVLVSTLDITERKQAERALQENQARLAGIINTAPNGIITIDSHSRIVLMNPAAETIFACTGEDLLGQSLNFLLPERFRANHDKFVNTYGGSGITHRRLGRFDTLYGLRQNGEEFPMEAFISHYENDGEKFYTVILQDITLRKRDEDNLRRRAEELQTVAAASSSLRKAQNVSEIISILAIHALQTVQASYASIYLFNSETGDFVSQGWYSSMDAHEEQSGKESELSLRPGQGITGYVASTGETYITEDIQNDPLILILDGERERLRNLHGSISLPLRHEETIIGVIHIISSDVRSFDETDTRLLTALAEMGGNAIHRASLFDQIRHYADELALAYDNTLAGWARALELRDELTEGHTRRVTELTLQLAHAMNVPESGLVQIRRGALLHDIGKMGIPDAILNKTGPLTAQERKIMQEHPQYAYNMLAAIPFLQSALDIPLFHHEHWDGNGYPRGLKGEAIPLAARIFTVVDVWDALTSDRPYRPAWPKEKTLEYIRAASGKQFDPQIVETFLTLIEGR